MLTDTPAPRRQPLGIFGVRDSCMVHCADASALGSLVWLDVHALADGACCCSGRAELAPVVPGGLLVSGGDRYLRYPLLDAPAPGCAADPQL